MLAGALGRGVSVLAVPYAAGTLDAVVVGDSEEIARRQACGLGPMTDPMVIEACAGLPLGHPVVADAVDPIARVALDGAAVGVVEVIDGCYVRLWRPAVEVIAVSASCRPRSWLPSLNHLSTGVGLADRYLLVEGPSASQPLIGRAKRLGVGVVTVSEGVPTIVTRPAGHPPRPGSRRWAFLEAAYAGVGSPLTGAWTRSEEPSEAQRPRRSDAPASPRH